MQLGGSVLERLEQKHYEQEEEEYKEEVDQLKRLPELFERGTWSRNDIEWIISWKAPHAFQKKIIRDFDKNSDEAVRQQVREAVDGTNARDQVEALTELHGVGVPVASAILLFINPERFTVIDKRVWGLLHDAGHLRYPLPDNPTADDYLIYLGACWALANEYGVGLRALDRALWAIEG